MKRFIIRTLCILLPFWGIIVTYIICDPLRVIWNYDDYIKYPARNVAYNSYKMLTKDDTTIYNSFIVGSSRSGYWPCQVWEKYLEHNAETFHLESSGDGLYNALERLSFIYSYVGKVSNILLIVDEDWLRKDYHHTGIQFRTPWQMRKNKDYLAFQMDAFRFYFSKDGFKEVHHIGQKFKYVLPSERDERCENHNKIKECLIDNIPTYYYSSISPVIYKNPCYPRDSIEQIGEPVITEKGVELLSQIHQLFVNGNTNYKIVVSPLYNQRKLNPADKSVLDGIFGAENVYDYSGINKYTADSLNYFESSHYRPRVAAQILEEIYAH